MLTFDSKEIGRKIKYWLDVKNLKQTHLAAAMGMTNTTISKKLRGQSPITLEEAIKIAKFLDLSLDSLLNHTLPSSNDSSVEKTTIKVNSLESIVEYVKRLPPQERDAVEGIYKRVLEAVIMAMEK